MIEWISVKDDLPDEGEEVLVWVEPGHPHDEGFFMEAQWSGNGWLLGSWISEHVTHWSRVNAPKRKRRAPGRKA